MTDQIARIRVSLIDTEPEIWRRVDVPLEASLKMLHDVIQGAMGWMDPAGDAAFNVAIRTICVEEGSGIGRLGLGSGIVADSDASAEWAECLAKGRFLSLG